MLIAAALTSVEPTAISIFILVTAVSIAQIGCVSISIFTLGWFGLRLAGGVDGEGGGWGAVGVSGG